MFGRLWRKLSAFFVHSIVNSARIGVCAALLFAVAGFSQTTQGLISGRLVSSVTGRPIAGASVTYSSSITNLAGAAQSDASGYYYLPLLLIARSIRGPLM